MMTSPFPVAAYLKQAAMMSPVGSGETEKQEMDKSHTDDAEYRPDADPDEWIMCPECGSEDAYHSSTDLWSYDGTSEKVVGREVEFRCPDCGVIAEIR